MRPATKHRTGVAAVETAVVLPLLLMFLSGIWIMGRMIETHQTLENAAREGARVAAQGSIVTQDGAYTDFTVDNVRTQVAGALQAGGVNFPTFPPSTTDLIVDYENLDFVPPSQPPTDNAPFNAKKGDRLIVTVRLRHELVRLPVIGKLPSWSLPDPDYLFVQVHIQSVRDDPFELNIELPTWTPN